MAGKSHMTSRNRNAFAKQSVGRGAPNKASKKIHENFPRNLYPVIKKCL
jgi:hypothetical protein